MKAKRSDLRKFRATTCSVTLGNEDGSVTFDVLYDAGIPASLYMSLVDMSALGARYVDIGKEFEGAGELPPEQQHSAIARAREMLSELKESLEEFAALLAQIVISQEYVDDDDKPIVPTLEYFRALPVEDQMAYATAIMTERQRPTVPTDTSCSALSIPAAGTGAAPLDSSSTEPQSDLAAPCSS